MNIDKSGVHVGYLLWVSSKQSVYTALVGRGGFLDKLDVFESDIKQLWSEAQKTGLFKSAGHELKVVIDRKFSTKVIEALINWLNKVVETISSHELK